MPRITKKGTTDNVIEEEKETKVSKKTTKKSSISNPKTSLSTSKKESLKKSDSKNKESETKKSTKIEKNKASSSSTSKKNSKSTSKTSTKRSSVIPFKSILSRRRTKKVIEPNDDEIYVDSNLVEQPTVLEYYDLPYRYNQTAVRILAQTPSVLFVYWDISDDDRAKFVEQYGENFFETTSPILLVHNKTKNYSFEVEINDFANSWYIRMQEPDCEYEIELLRRNHENNSKYIYVSSSNNIISPNNHVLFEKTDFSNIAFRNVKTGQLTYKDYGSLRLLTNIEDIYKLKHKVLQFYRDMYNNEVLESHGMFSNPSSSNPSSRML